MTKINIYTMDKISALNAIMTRDGIGKHEAKTKIMMQTLLNNYGDVRFWCRIQLPEEYDPRWIYFRSDEELSTIFDNLDKRFTGWSTPPEHPREENSYSCGNLTDYHNTHMNAILLRNGWIVTEGETDDHDRLNPPEGATLVKGYRVWSAWEDEDLDIFIKPNGEVMADDDKWWNPNKDFEWVATNDLNGDFRQIIDLVALIGYLNNN